MRKKLQPGTQIRLVSENTTRVVVVDQVIGDGANCVAYDVHSPETDGIVSKFRLKECYPYCSSIDRIGQVLNWQNTLDRSRSFDKFRKANQILSDLHNESSIGNSITRSELYEANGTLYSLMEVNHATVYSNDKSSHSLHEIIDTILTLTKVVNRLHKIGYLHLDIKPENFQVTYHPHIAVWLFDVDSLTPIDDIKKGNILHVPYSQTWAAPEQVMNQVSRIGPHTDLFAIGAILFSKLMGRNITSDDSGLFANWSFDSDIFENINPKVKQCLTDVLHNTLAASTKRRYATAQELEEKLEEVLHIIVAGEPYLESHNIKPINSFIGRNDEIKHIQHAFSCGQHIVFLHGVAGIGKSEVAKAYASISAQNYDAQLFCRYKGSIQELLDGLEIQNFSGGVDDHRKILPKLLNKRILLILDNVDILPGEDPGLFNLFSLNCDVLITSRTDFSSICDQGCSVIDITRMNNDVLFSLCQQLSGCSFLENADIAAFSDFINRTNGHTMLTDLFAKQLRASDKSIQELCRRYEGTLYSLCGMESVQSIKDGCFSKGELPILMEGLFNLSDLSTIQEQVLRNLAILDFMVITKDSYKDVTSGKNDEINALNDLVELGWVSCAIHLSYQEFSLHPLVEDVVLHRLTPSLEKCEGICHHLRSIIPNEYDWESSIFGDEYERSKAEKANEFICHALLNTSFSDYASLHLLLTWLCKMPRRSENDDDEDDQFSMDMEDAWHLPGAIHYPFSDLYKQIENYIQKIDIIAEEPSVSLSPFRVSRTLSSFILDVFSDTSSESFSMSDIYTSCRNELCNADGKTLAACLRFLLTYALENAWLCCRNEIYYSTREYELKQIKEALPNVFRHALIEANRIPNQVLQTRAIQKAQWAIYRNLVYGTTVSHYMLDHGNRVETVDVFPKYIADVLFNMLDCQYQQKVNTARAENEKHRLEWDEKHKASNSHTADCTNPMGYEPIVIKYIDDYKAAYTKAPILADILGTKNLSIQQKVKILCDEYSNGDASPSGELTSISSSQWRTNGNWDDAAQSLCLEREFLYKHKDDVISISGQNAWNFKTWVLWAADVVLLGVTGHEKEFLDEYLSNLSELEKIVQESEIRDIGWALKYSCLYWFGPISVFSGILWCVQKSGEKGSKERGHHNSLILPCLIALLNTIRRKKDNLPEDEQHKRDLSLYSFMEECLAIADLACDEISPDDSRYERYNRVRQQLERKLLELRGTGGIIKRKEV